MYSNSCHSCSFEIEIIKIGQSSHKMYSNNIVNFQESTMIVYILYIYIVYIYIYIYRLTPVKKYIYIYIYIYIYKVRVIRAIPSHLENQQNKMNSSISNNSV